MRNTTLYKIAGTKTFRLGSTEVLGRFGTNLQNISKEMRSIYTADLGKVLVQVDQSGAEALIVAYECRPGKYRELFIHNVKPHVFVALHNFKEEWMLRFNPVKVLTAIVTPIDKLKSLPFWKDLDTLIKSSDNWEASKRFYYIAKMVVHASNYAMRENTFQTNVLEKSKGTIVLTLYKSREQLEGYHSLFPEIRNWHTAISNQVRTTNTLRNLFGYPREFTQVVDDKEAYAFIPQSTVGCITHIAYTNLFHYVREMDLKWDLLGNCHDSYLAQCPEGEQVECARMMRLFMEQELVGRYGDKFKMRSEAQWGYNWAPWKKEKNEQGLREFTI